MLMKADQSCLLVIDVQERLSPVMADPRKVIHHCSILMRAAARLDIPVMLTEQYPKGIGPTVFDLRELAPPSAIVEKLHFSCAEEAVAMERIEALGRRQAVLCGIEAHVCVQQSALRLKEKGYEVFVVADACSSRNADNARLAFERMRQNGIGIVSTEMVVFEWLHCAGTPEFKDLIALIK